MELEQVQLSVPSLFPKKHASPRICAAILFTVLCLGFFQNARAANCCSKIENVDGSFMLYTKDITMPSKGELFFIRRIYKSGSSYSGIFGNRWGFNYATYLVKNKNGTLSLFENGIDDPKIFVPKSSDKDNNRVWYSKASKKYDQIVLNNKGYLRGVAGESKETYSYATGQLIHIEDINGFFLDLLYAGNSKKLKTIRNDSYRLDFEYNGQGLVERIVGNNGMEADFKYDEEKGLIYSIDSFGEETTYENDKKTGLLVSTEVGEKQMTLAEYETVQTINMKKSFAAKGFENLDGTYVKTYAYRTTPPKDKRTIGQRHVTIKKYNGLSLPLDETQMVDLKEDEKSEIQYTLSKDEYGNSYISQKILIQDGHIFKTTFAEGSDRPVVETEDGIVQMEYKYDPDYGRVVQRYVPTEKLLEYREYHPVFINKPIYIERSDSNFKIKYWFKYNDQGNLIHAEDSDGELIQFIFYNNFDQWVVHRRGQEPMRFKRNEWGLFEKIGIESLDEITLIYDQNAEVKDSKVENIDTLSRLQRLTEVIAHFMKLAEIDRI